MVSKNGFTLWLVLIAAALVTFPALAEALPELAMHLTLAAVFIYALKMLFSPRKAVLLDFGGVVSEGDYYTEPIRIRKEMPAFISSLKSRNYRVALLSNQNSAVADFLSKKYGLDRLFHAQIISGKVGVKKPDRRIYEHALSVMGVKPHNAYFVDDHAENVEGAKKLGMNAIQFRSMKQLSGAIN